MLQTISAVTGLVLFAVNTALHLFWGKFKNLTKALIIPTVLVVYFCFVKEISWVFVAAVAASWLGDVLLEKQGNAWFTAGGIAFMLSHLLFSVSYIPFIGFHSKRLLLAIPVACVYLLIGLLTAKKTGKTENSIGTGLIFLYLMFNAVMNILAFCLLLCKPSLAGALIYCGAILFYVSDNCLFFEVFRPNGKDWFITVIGTYIAGEFLIALGMALM